MNKTSHKDRFEQLMEKGQVWLKWLF